MKALLFVSFLNMTRKYLKFGNKEKKMEWAKNVRTNVAPPPFRENFCQPLLNKISLSSVQFYEKPQVD